MNGHTQISRSSDFYPEFEESLLQGAPKYCISLF